MHYRLAKDLAEKQNWTL